jgi:hypothetical protein
MQLTRASAAAFALAASLASATVRADDVTSRGSTEVAAYQDSFATSVLTPSIGLSAESPTAGWRANARYLVDVVTAASPDIVATASPRWTEVRHAGSVGARYKPGTIGAGVTASTSYTPDYLSLAAGAQLVEDLDDKNLTLTQSYSYGHDTIGRTGTPFSVFSRSLDMHAFSLGASRVVSSTLVVAVSGDLVVERGDQSKPYRYIPIFAPEVAAGVPRGATVASVAALRIQARPLEQLPLERERGAISGRLAWRIGSSTLRLDERLYTDTWGLEASTTDGRWLFDVSRRVTVWPHLRAHAQSAVSFWKRAYAARSIDQLPALRTGDRELGALFSLGTGSGVRLALGKPGALDDIVLVATLDGTWTTFADTIYVTQRLSAIAATSLEVAF